MQIHVCKIAFGLKPGVTVGQLLINVNYFACELFENNEDILDTYDGM